MTLLKEKLQTAKSEWTKQHNEAVDLKQKKAVLETQGEKMVTEIATLKMLNNRLQKDAESAQQAAEAGRRAVEVADAAKKILTQAAEVSKKEKEVAVAKAQNSEDQRVELQKEKELAEQRLAAVRQEVEKSKSAVKKEQESVKKTETSRDAALGKCAKFESELKALTDQKMSADGTVIKLKIKVAEVEKALERSMTECKKIGESLSEEEHDMVALNVQLVKRKSIIVALEAKVADQDLKRDEDVSKLRKTFAEQQSGYQDLKTRHAATEIACASSISKRKELEDKLLAAHEEFAEKQKAQEALAEKLEGTTAQVASLHVEFKDEKEKASKLQSQVVQEREKKKELDAANAKQISELQTKIKNLLVKNDTFESTMKVFENSRKDLEHQLQQEIVVKTRAEQELVKGGQKIERANAELETALEQIKQLQDRIIELEECVERDQLKAEDEAKKWQEAHAQQEQTESVLERKKQSVMSLEDKVKKLQTELRDTAAEAAKQAAVLSKTKSENIRMDMEIESLTAKLRKLQTSHNELEIRVVDMDRKLMQSHDEVEAQQKRSEEKSTEIEFLKAEMETARREVEKVSTEMIEMEEKLCTDITDLQEHLHRQIADLEKKLKEVQTARENVTHEYMQVQHLAQDSILQMKGVHISECQRFQVICLMLEKAVEGLRLEVVGMHSKIEKQSNLIVEYETALHQRNADLQDKTKHLGIALVHIDDGRQQVGELQVSLKVANARGKDLDQQLHDMENLNEELSRQKNLLADALDADRVTLLGYIKMLQAAGTKFFPDPFPERCHLKIPDRVWLITIEFSENRKMLDDLLHQSYIEEDFNKGTIHMTALPGGLTKRKVDNFGVLLQKMLENHADSKTGLDREALVAVGQSIWLDLNPKEAGRADQQAAILATAILDGVAPKTKFAFDMLQKWLDSITQIIGGLDVDAPKSDLAVACRRDRHTLTAAVDDYDRNALWIHSCSLMDYMLQSCGRKIAHLSTEELRLLQLTHFLRQHEEQQDSTYEDDDILHNQRDSGNEYWKRDSDSTYSQSSFVDRFRMSWDKFQKVSAGGISAPTTPRSHFSLGSISMGGGEKTARSNISNDGHKTARSNSSWFMGDHLFEA